MVRSLATLLALGALVPSTFSHGVPRFAPPRSCGAKKALYFLENVPDGAKLAALEINGNDGSFSKPTETFTDGRGLQNLNATSGTPLGPDSLSGQGAVAVGDDYVFTVNPGSNTLATFKIPQDDPTHPVLFGKPKNTMGEFPVSVSYSSKLQTACVLNGGAKSGVSCYCVDQNGARGVKPLDKQPRPLPGFQQSTPPKGPPNTASQVEFSPSSKYLVAVVKGEMGKTGPGSIYVFRVNRRGEVSHKGVRSRIPGIFTDFGFSFVQGSDHRFFLSTADFGGGSLLKIDERTLKVEEVGRADGGKKLKATCWAEYSEPLDTAYSIDAATPNMVAANPKTGKFEGIVSFDEKFMGAFDTVIDGTTAYFLASTSDVVAVDLASAKKGGKAKTLQSVDLKGKIADRKYWQGLAMYPNKAW